MAWENIQFTIPGLAADADLTARQYCFVDLAAAGLVDLSGLASRPLGVLQNAPDEDDGAEVGCFGVTKLVAGVGDLAVGDEVIPGANGTGIAAAGGAGATYGVVLVAADAGNLATVLINTTTTVV